VTFNAKQPCCCACCWLLLYRGAMSLRQALKRSLEAQKAAEEKETAAAEEAARVRTCVHSWGQRVCARC